MKISPANYFAQFTFLLLGLLCVQAPFVPVANAQERAWHERFQIFGYADVVVGENRYDSETVGFDAYHFTTNMNVEVSKHWRLFTDVTYEHGTMHTESGNTGDLKARYQIVGTLHSWFEVRAGKFLAPFGEQNTYHDASPTYLSVTSPRSLYWKRKLEPTGAVKDRLFSKEAAGLWFAGGGDLGKWFLNYDLYYINGRSSANNPYKYDKKDHDKPIGVQINLTSPGGIKIGTSFYTEDHEPTDSKISLATLQLGGELFDRLIFQSEYMLGKLKHNQDTYDNQVDAYYVQLAYRFGSWVPFVRYDSFEDKDKWNGDGEHIQTLGVNYNIERNVFLKLEYAGVKEGQDVWQSQISLAF